MDKVIISEAFDALHEYNNKSKKKNIIKENTSVNKRVVTKRNPYKRLVESYKDFDSYYDAAWEMFMDRVEYVDDAIEGGRGTTYIRFPGDTQVYKIDEEEAVDNLYDLFNDGEDISKAVECLGGLADISSMRYNESIYRPKARKKNIMEAPMSPEDKRDTELFRSIEKKYYDAQQGNDARKIKYTPAEQDFARRYNLTLPQRVGRSKYKVSPIWDNEDPSSETVLDKGLTTDVAISNLSSMEDKLLGNDRERPQDMSKVNMADYIRKRRERGRPVDRETRAVGYDWHRNEITGDGSEYPHGPTSIDYLLTSNDDKDIFGDTTFVHDNKARFSSDDGKMMDDAKFTPQERARIHQNAGIRKQRQQAIDDLQQKQGVKKLRHT
jgi:hypothetical protein